MAYPCDQCVKTFKSSQGRTYHLNSVHENIRYACQFCDKIFSFDFNFEQHLKVHHGYNHITRIHKEEGPFKCATCAKNFNKKDQLKRHQITHTGKKIHKCTICSKSFGVKSSLDRHQQTHLNLPFHSCPKCPRKLRWESSLKKHLQTFHSGTIQTVDCIFCEKVIPNRYDYFKHLYHHVGEKPFSCNLCKKEFILKANRNEHIRRKHTFEKPHACGSCGRKFTTNKEVRLHSKIHLTENKPKPFNCIFCGNGFTEKGNLFRHILSHIKEKAHSCQLCEKEFHDTGKMDRHVKSVHGTGK